MKRNVLLLAVAFLLVACAIASFFASSRSVGPVTVSFLRCTNGAFLDYTAHGLVTNSNVRQACFQLKNHTASKLDVQVRIDAFGQGRSTSQSFASHCGDLGPHATETLSVVTPGSTNGWQLVAVIAASGRPYWQERVDLLSRRLGHPLYFPPRQYPSTTNVWRID